MRPLFCSIAAGVRVLVDGPISLTASSEDEPQLIRKNHHDVGWDGTWSDALRADIRSQSIINLGSGCFSVPPDSTLGALAAITQSETICFPDDNSSFLQVYGLYGEDPNADLDKRAYNMDNRERATIQSEIDVEEDRWPDDRDPEDPDAPDDEIPEWQQNPKFLDKLVDLAKLKFKRLGKEDIDIRPHVYPILADAVADAVFVGGCPRNYTQPCPVSWSLEEPSTCKPPSDYRGICSVLNIASLQNRADDLVIKRLEGLARTCWFEYPCVSSGQIFWNQPCSSNYWPLTYTTDEGRSEVWCLRTRELAAKCAPMIRSFDAPMKKAIWSFNCEEPWQADSSTEVLSIGGKPLAFSDGLLQTKWTNMDAVENDAAPSGPIGYLTGDIVVPMNDQSLVMQ